MSSDLKPCPFCGATDGFEFQYSTPDKEGVPVCAICPECGTTGPWVYVENIVTMTHTAFPSEGWNRRVTDVK